MNAIRVRGFDLNAGTIYTPKELAYANVALLPIGGFVNVDELNLKFSKPLNHLIPSLSSGEFDKNGIEIFQGDEIEIKYKLDTFNRDGEKVKREVIFKHGKFITVNGIGMHLGLHYVVDSFDVEVVGHVFKKSETEIPVEKTPEKHKPLVAKPTGIPFHCEKMDAGKICEYYHCERNMNDEVLFDMCTHFDNKEISKGNTRIELCPLQPAKTEDKIVDISKFTGSNVTFKFWDDNEDSAIFSTLLGIRNGSDRKFYLDAAVYGCWESCKPVLNEWVEWNGNESGVCPLPDGLVVRTVVGDEEATSIHYRQLNWSQKLDKNLVIKKFMIVDLQEGWSWNGEVK